MWIILYWQWNAFEFIDASGVETRARYCHGEERLLRLNEFWLRRTNIVEYVTPTATIISGVDLLHPRVSDWNDTSFLLLANTRRVTAVRMFVLFACSWATGRNRVLAYGDADEYPNVRLNRKHSDGGSYYANYAACYTSRIWCIIYILILYSHVIYVIYEL